MTDVISYARLKWLCPVENFSRVVLRFAHKKSAAPVKTETTQSAHAASRYLKISSGPCRLSVTMGRTSRPMPLLDRPSQATHT
jgi:hypothetical protein